MCRAGDVGQFVPGGCLQRSSEEMAWWSGHVGWVHSSDWSAAPFWELAGKEMRRLLHIGCYRIPAQPAISWRLRTGAKMGTGAWCEGRRQTVRCGSGHAHDAAPFRAYGGSVTGSVFQRGKERSNLLQPWWNWQPKAMPAGAADWLRLQNLRQRHEERPLTGWAGTLADQITRPGRERRHDGARTCSRIS